MLNIVKEIKITFIFEIQKYDKFSKYQRFEYYDTTHKEALHKSVSFLNRYFKNQKYFLIFDSTKTPAYSGKIKIKKMAKIKLTVDDRAKFETAIEASNVTVDSFSNFGAISVAIVNYRSPADLYTLGKLSEKVTPRQIKPSSPPEPPKK